jgi:hypothetical protein
LALALGAGGVKSAGSQTERVSPLPPPSGQFLVGRAQFEWTDDSRSDAENANGHRQLVVWLWYPAVQPTNAEPAEWMPGKWSEAFWSGYVEAHRNLADQKATHPIDSIRSHAYTNAAVAATAAPYPVVLFAPGLGTTPLEYATLVEDLASHGYIVAGVGSTYIAAATVFADGRVVKGRDPMADLSERGKSRPTTDQALRRFEDLASTVSKDLAFALDQLTKMNADVRSPLKGRVDLAHVGALGHSLGGAGVAQLGVDDARVRAVFDIDGSPIWRAANPAIRKFVLVLSAAATNLGYDELLRGAEPGRHLMLSRSTHAFSSDLRLMPFQPESMRNPAPTGDVIAPARALAVTAAYADAFFGQYLKARPSPLLARPSREYPEIVFER